jgi:Ca2+/Na+ antiporter
MAKKFLIEKIRGQMSALLMLLLLLLLLLMLLLPCFAEWRVAQKEGPTQCSCNYL